MIFPQTHWFVHRLMWYMNLHAEHQHHLPPDALVRPSIDVVHEAARRAPSPPRHIGSSTA